MTAFNAARARDNVNKCLDIAGEYLSKETSAILARIEAASKKGESSIYLGVRVEKIVQERLEKLGFVCTNTYDQRDGYSFTITW